MKVIAERELGFATESGSIEYTKSVLTDEQ